MSRALEVKVAELERRVDKIEAAEKASFEKWKAMLDKATKDQIETIVPRETIRLPQKQPRRQQ